MTLADWRSKVADWKGSRWISIDVGELAALLNYVDKLRARVAALEVLLRDG